MKRVIAVNIPRKHDEDSSLFNQSLIALHHDRFNIVLVTTEAQKIHFDQVSNMKVHTLGNFAKSNKKAGARSTMGTQIRLFFIILRLMKRRDTVYINSYHNVAASLAARVLFKARIIYFIQHTESSRAMRLFKAVINRTAYHVIFDSAELQSNMPLKVNSQSVVSQPPASTAGLNDDDNPGDLLFDSQITSVFNGRQLVFSFVNQILGNQMVALNRLS